MRTLKVHEAAELRNNVEGRVVLHDDAGYEALRRVWNGMIDRRPAAIVQCATRDDVPCAIAFARKHGLEITARGAGHNIAGNAVSNGGLVIDFSLMNAVRIDPEGMRAFVEPGATLGDFDAAAQKHGLATPVGINSTTGIAGLTLGGGFGWLTRKYGMTVDNLLAADVVTADGASLRASADDNPELYWALRGGGGNFGIVTQFEFRLHPVGPDVVAGLIVFPLDEAKTVLPRYRDLVQGAPEELSVWAVLRKAPPLPFLPVHVHGKPALVLAIFYGGSPEEADKAIAPLRRLGAAWGEHIGRQPYVQWQQAFDPLLTAGARNYWKSHNFAALPDAAVEILVERAHDLPGPECEIFLGHVGGAANRVPVDAMAYGHRDAQFVMNVHGRWSEVSDDAAGIAWARGVFHALAPYASSGAYVNFMTDDESDRVASAYGANHPRLAELKARYDPHNVFHINQNIVPATPQERARRKEPAIAR